MKWQMRLRRPSKFRKIYYEIGWIFVGGSCSYCTRTEDEDACVFLVIDSLHLNRKKEGKMAGFKNWTVSDKHQTKPYNTPTFDWLDAISNLPLALSTHWQSSLFKSSHGFIWGTIKPWMFVSFLLLPIHLIPSLSFSCPFLLSRSLSAVDSLPLQSSNLTLLPSNQVLEQVALCNNLETLPVSCLKKKGSNEFN